MKLITEMSFNGITSLTEDKEDGTKDLYIQGIFMQSEVVNGNNRLYPDEILNREFIRYNTQMVQTNRAIGEHEHPIYPEPNSTKASHRITEMWKDGTNYYGKALILNNDYGNQVRSLIEGGVQLGVSTRGLGTLTRGDDHSVINDDFTLKTVDIVANPSAPDAFVNGIYEGVDFSNGNQTLAEQQDNIRKRVMLQRRVPTDSEKIKFFESFLQTVRSEYT